MGLVLEAHALLCIMYNIRSVHSVTESQPLQIAQPLVKTSIFDTGALSGTWGGAMLQILPGTDLT